MAISTAPGAPTLNTRGSTSLTLDWTAASTTDGSTITGYVVHAGGNTTSTSGTSATVSGLSGGTQYSVWVTANCSDATSLDSATNLATTNPQTPNPPTTSSRTTTSIDLSSSSAGGNVTTIYIVGPSTKASPASFTGLTAGSSYSFYSYATYVTSGGTTLTSGNSGSNTASTLPNPPPSPSWGTVGTYQVIVNTGPSPSGGSSGVEVVCNGATRQSTFNTSETFSINPDTAVTATLRTKFSSLYSSSVSLSTRTLPDSPTVNSTSYSTSVSSTTLTAQINFTRYSSSTDWDWKWLTGTTWDVTGVTASSVSVSGLSYSTSYSYAARGYTSPNYSVANTSGSFTTPAPPLPGTPSASPTLDTAKGDAGRLQGGFYLKWGSATNVQYYRVLAKRQWDGVVTTFDQITGTSATITGLQDGIAYDLSVLAYNVHGQSAATATNPATTKPAIPSISMDTSSGATKIIVNVSMSSANWTDITVRRLDSTGVLIDSKTITGSQAVWDTAAGDSITVNTTYQFDARSRFVQGATSLYSDYCAKISFKTARPTSWSWTTAKDANGHKNSGVTFSMLATEWGAFQDKVDAFRTYKSIAAYTWTRAAAGGDVTATLFNQAVTAINAIPNKTVAPPASKSKGDNCNASDFNSLMDSLNSTP